MNNINLISEVFALAKKNNRRRRAIRAERERTRLYTYALAEINQIAKETFTTEDIEYMTGLRSSVTGSTTKSVLDLLVEVSNET